MKPPLPCFTVGMSDPNPKSSSGGGQTADTLVHHKHRLDHYENLIQQLYQVQQDTCATLNSVSHRIVALDNRLGTLFPTSPAPPSVSATPPTAPLPSLREPEMKPSECFEGDTDRSGGFLLQCNLAFARSPSLFLTHAAKITYIVAALKGRALHWAQAFLGSHSKDTLDFSRFVQEFRHVFDHPLQQEEAAKRLLTLRQGCRSVADYLVDFRITAEEAGWNELSLRGIFTGSLSDTIKNQLATRDEPATLDKLISLAIRIYNRLRERQRERNAESLNPLAEVEPMQVGRTRLSAEERQRRFRAKECIYCGNKGHFVANSLSGPLKFSPTSLFSLPAKIITEQTSLPIAAMVDSGSELNLISQSLVDQLNLPVQALDSARTVTGLTGHAISQITHHVINLQVLVSGNHHESGEFFVFSSLSPQLIFGFPWLEKHNPVLNWSGGRVEESAEAIDLVGVPQCYHDLAPAFSKLKALSLPPHRPYDCAVELLPGAPLPTSRLYHLSGPETEAMRTYINESLASGIIRPSTSPLGAGFFFVEKKDKTLRPCIDFRGLNQITVKNRYPLPLIDSVHERLHSATIFSKLDLRNAYHLVRIREGDEWKTAFKTPLGHFKYLVMPFGRLPLNPLWLKQTDGAISH
uniref:ribonuclease H n=1 Tax=Kryptolebias marmoratus TaxID=37003 RepID=A0A3Q3FUQ0_KRYMA